MQGFTIKVFLYFTLFFKKNGGIYDELVSDVQAAGA